MTLDIKSMETYVKGSVFIDDNIIITPKGRLSFSYKFMTDNKIEKFKFMNLKYKKEKDKLVFALNFNDEKDSLTNKSLIPYYLEGPTRTYFDTTRLFRELQIDLSKLQRTGIEIIKQESEGKTFFTFELKLE